MLLQELTHSETLDLLIAEDGGHGVIRGEVLLVLGVLESLLLQVGPESLDTLNERVVICERNDWKFPTWGREIFSPCSVPMILASSGDTLSSIYTMIKSCMAWLDIRQNETYLDASLLGSGHLGVVGDGVGTWLGWCWWSAVSTFSEELQLMNELLIQSHALKSNVLYCVLQCTHTTDIWPDLICL